MHKNIYIHYIKIKIYFLRFSFYSLNTVLYHQWVMTNDVSLLVKCIIIIDYYTPIVDINI